MASKDYPELQVPESEQDVILKTINLLKNKGLNEARIRIDDIGEAWIIRKTATLVRGGSNGSSNG